MPNPSPWTKTRSSCMFIFSIRLHNFSLYSLFWLLSSLNEYAQDSRDKHRVPPEAHELGSLRSHRCLPLAKIAKTKNSHLGGAPMSNEACTSSYNRLIEPAGFPTQLCRHVLKMQLGSIDTNTHDSLTLLQSTDISLFDPPHIPHEQAPVR